MPGMEDYTGEIVYAAKRAGVECFLGDASCLKHKVTCVARPCSTVRVPLHTNPSTWSCNVHFVPKLELSDMSRLACRTC